MFSHSVPHSRWVLAWISASALEKASVQLFEKQSNATFNVCEKPVFAAGALSEPSVEVRRVGSHLGPSALNQYMCIISYRSVNNTLPRAHRTSLTKCGAAHSSVHLRARVITRINFARLLEPFRRRLKRRSDRGKFSVSHRDRVHCSAEN